MKTKLQLLLTLALAALSAAAQVPGIISHQGRVTVNGTNYTGSGLFKFALVNAAGDTTYWSNDGSGSGAEPAAAVALTVAWGIFSVNLGDTNVANMTQGIPASVFTNSAVYLRTWFNDGTDGSQLLAPDRQITSVGYALVAGSLTGPVTLAQLPAAVLTNGAGGVNLAGAFTGDGNGLTNLNLAQGPQGIAGTNGVNGTNGLAGATGSQGSTGLTGNTGPQGSQGVAGSNGTNGVNGVNGVNGTNGATGPAGALLANVALVDTNQTFTGINTFSGNVLISGGVLATNAGNQFTGSLTGNGSGLTNLTIATASGSQAGTLSSTDWTTFNSKVSATRNIATTAPLAGGGTLAGDLTLSLPVATTSANGYLASADWTTFNNKVATTRTVSTTAPLTGGGSLAGNLTVALPAATTSANGYLASADWNTFSGKIGGSGSANYVPKFTASGTVGNSALFSDANGNVGIGTITPTGKLEVIDNGASSGGNTARFYNPSLADAGIHYISIGKSSVNNECALMGFTKQAAISKAWLGVTGDDIIGGIGLTVQKGGNVGIGDNSPAYRFSVFNNISGDYAARIYNGANSGTAHGLLIRAGSNGQPFGSVMIGFQNIDGAAIGNISQNAAFTVLYNTSSDRRLKENITPTHFGLADLMKLQAVDYNFIADAAKTPQTGFIAQDLDAVFPDAVTEGGDDATTKPWSVDYGRVTPLLVKSIQDLKAENDALKAQNAAILQRLAALEAKLGQ